MPVLWMDQPAFCCPAYGVGVEIQGSELPTQTLKVLLQVDHSGHLVTLDVELRLDSSLGLCWAYFFLLLLTRDCKLSFPLCLLAVLEFKCIYSPILSIWEIKRKPRNLILLLILKS